MVKGKECEFGYRVIEINLFKMQERVGEIGQIDREFQIKFLD